MAYMGDPDNSSAQGGDNAAVDDEASDAVGLELVPQDAWDDGDCDDSQDGEEEEELDEEAAEARIRELTARLDEVVGALCETEEANGMLQEEIKQLLEEQNEQEELRHELHEQLRERGELMQMMAQQTVADSNTSTDILDRIQKLRAESEKEKQAFRAEMDQMDDRLEDLARQDPDAAPVKVHIGPLDGVD